MLHSSRVWPTILLGLLGWKSHAGTNTLAYKEHLKIMAVKSFITLGPGLKFASKTKSLSYNGAPEIHTMWVGSGSAHKCLTRLEMLL